MTSPLPVGATPVSGSSSGPAPLRGLPPKLLEDASHRLSVLAVFVAVVIVVIQIFQRIAQPLLRPVLDDPIIRLVTLATVLMALALYALQRYHLVPASTMLKAGMAFEVGVAFDIGMIETAIPFNPNVPLLGLSALGPWVVFVGALIPNQPRWTALTAFIAATTWPIAYAINASRLGFVTESWSLTTVWPAINYLMAFFAYIVGRRTYGTACEAQTAQELGSYRLVAPIGEGGMGEVWKASHQMLARAAAIKLVKPVVADVSARQAENFVRRFRREANVIAGLQSPHTVYLYDFGTSKDGRFYYVMELLDGVSLQTLVSTFGPQPAARVVSILRQICRSLEEAHAQGLVHRDLKPSNVMVCKVGLQYDFVKVLDFGLAKPVAGENITRLTVEGVAAGTPGYIAPEVALGETAVDHRADLYALGCVGYFLLTGSVVFPDSNPVSMALKHVQATPEPPSSRTELPISVELERVIMHCLEKNPAHRPASARDIDDLLQSCGVDEWTDRHAEAWWERHLPPSSTLRSFAQPAPATPPIVQKV